MQEEERRTYSGKDTIHTPQTSQLVLDLLSTLGQKRQESRNMLQGSKNRIYKKWRALKPDQRKAFLLKHCPDLRCHDYFDHVWTYNNDISELRTETNSLLLNQLNLDELQHDRTAFLSLIHNRTEFGSEAWIPFDRQSFNIYWEIGLIEVPFSSNCVIIRGPEYGMVVSWDADRVHGRDALPVHYMLLVLQLQD
jgi:hypothetical protein